MGQAFVGGGEQVLNVVVVGGELCFSVIKGEIDATLELSEGCDPPSLVIDGLATERDRDGIEIDIASLNNGFPTGLMHWRTVGNIPDLPYNLLGFPRVVFQEVINGSVFRADLREIIRPRELRKFSGVQLRFLVFRRSLT